MTFFYLFLVKSFWILSPFLALFIPKIKAFRRQRLNQAWVKMNSPIWFHVASLGEFEQVKPLIKVLKTSEQSHEILLTFFSNSAYESAQKYAYVDQIGFLPFETEIDDFIHFIQPKMAVWVRYELWFATWKSLYNRKIPIILLNAFLP
ncbi:MAG: hypothetical protein MUE53_09960, partial [Chitinophagales bacterium]|nr:hypothetical protein [Chitinophagales bacterium]